MGIEYENKQYTSNVDIWKRIDNVCDAKEVKQYLITLNPTDTSPEMAARNDSYKDRAVFYQITGYTTTGMLGIIFNQRPVLEAPDALEYLKDNANGTGLSIYQQTQQTAREVVRKSRAGLFVSYPKNDGVISQADVDTGEIFSTIHKIDAIQIINWRETLVGSKMKLTLVVIKEAAEEIKDDGFTVNEIEQHRELSLVGGVYTIQLWRKGEKGWDKYEEPIIPRDGKGNTWDVIPFVFIGADNNSPDVDEPYLKGLVDLNVAHFRNSADWEESVWFCGQLQPWMSGIDQAYLDLMTKNNMYVGSGQLMGVPSGETFGIAQGAPNPVVRQAMTDKLEMMIGMGARFIQSGGGAKTATESEAEQRAQYSVLATIAENVKAGYVQALDYVARYMNVEDEIIYKMQTEFTITTATAQELQAVIAGFVQNALPVGAYFRWLQTHGLESDDKTLEEFEEELGAGVSMPDLDDEVVEPAGEPVE